MRQRAKVIEHSPHYEVMPPAFASRTSVLATMLRPRTSSLCTNELPPLTQPGGSPRTFSGPDGPERPFRSAVTGYVTWGKAVKPPLEPLGIMTLELQSWTWRRFCVAPLGVTQRCVVVKIKSENTSKIRWILVPHQCSISKSLNNNNNRDIRQCWLPRNSR